MIKRIKRLLKVVNSCAEFENRLANLNREIEDTHQLLLSVSSQFANDQDLHIKQNRTNIYELQAEVLKLQEGMK